MSTSTIVLAGDPSSGFSAVGPFDSFVEAETWADSMTAECNTWVMPMVTSEEYHAGCHHEPDWSTLTPADGAPGIVDVCCRKCNRSGSMRIDSNDVDFGEEEPDGPHATPDSGTD